MTLREEDIYPLKVQTREKETNWRASYLRVKTREKFHLSVKTFISDQRKIWFNCKAKFLFSLWIYYERLTPRNSFHPVSSDKLDKAKEKSLKVAKNIDVKNHRKDKQFLVHCLLYRNPNNNADIALEWATKQILNSNISHMYVGEWSCLLWELGKAITNEKFNQQLKFAPKLINSILSWYIKIH